MLRSWREVNRYQTSFNILTFSLKSGSQQETLGNKPYKLCIYSPEPRTEVYCFELNRNWSILILKCIARLTADYYSVFSDHILLTKPNQMGSFFENQSKYIDTTTSTTKLSSKINNRTKRSKTTLKCDEP